VSGSRTTELCSVFGFFVAPSLAGSLSLTGFSAGFVVSPAKAPDFKPGVFGSLNFKPKAVASSSCPDILPLGDEVAAVF
jgi:hypothetical protein